MSEDELKEATSAYQMKPSRSEFEPLIDQLYREEVLDARKMSPEEKFLAFQPLTASRCLFWCAAVERLFARSDERAYHPGQPKL